MAIETLKSCAKINIGLNIINKRSDGYHNLETIFYPVNICDDIEIKIEPSEQSKNTVTISSNNPSLPTDSLNLCYKAVDNFFLKFPIKEHYDIMIHIDKKIPVGGGLAGGSSNAGTVIKFLADYFGISLMDNWDKLIAVCLSVGSDVPFFLFGKPCYASGRGERMIPLNNFKIEYDVLLVNPNIEVSTKKAFELLGYETGEIHESSLELVNNFDPKYPGLFTNDFEKVVFKEYPEIADIKSEMMKSGAMFASMSGSGATVYGFFAPQNRDKLLNAKEFFSGKGYSTFVSYFIRPESKNL